MGTIGFRSSSQDPFKSESGSRPSDEPDYRYGSCVFNSFLFFWANLFGLGSLPLLYLILFLFFLTSGQEEDN